MASGYARTGSSRKPLPIDMGKLRRSRDAYKSYNIQILRFQSEQPNDVLFIRKINTQLPCSKQFVHWSAISVDFTTESSTHLKALDNILPDSCA
ncbi:unnamed protein product [Macrosiphum euphorbiae]|uniref:Uncharacterized protein n=1 Tax=Macrosiphum euphorbiae TaxID=13131 RepID=A0AAV0VHI8_9HEMI|nr:unnamed protein product [Macrosiphum euphorbiae]